MSLLFLDDILGRPLPEQDEIFPDESGNGYALRMLCRNGLIFSDLAVALASPGHRYLPESVASRIAYLFGSKTPVVRRAIPVTYKRGGRLVTRFMDQEIGRPYHTRLTRPQVCTECLDELGRALAVWDISLVTACPNHRTVLIDFCPECHRRLSWRRPGITYCFCGFELASHRSPPASEDLIWMSRCIENALFNLVADQNSETLRILKHLSLDCLLRLVRGIGISENPNSRDLVPGKLTRILSSVEARAVVTRATFRIIDASLKVGKRHNPSLSPVWDIDDLLIDASYADSLTIQRLLNIARVGDISARRRFESEQIELDLDDGDE